ncbi:MAG: type IV-A pilus assembly ATPase PilB [Gammaproteobacteria bacterium]|nr:MAG: type IV-A pilus assembly ATPase PilB [Gammaproteobacteria bacterium]RTZ60796.1 MAG: type IV-A pilus assembly ATPase PilB [Gammaproteobacteria bacterium]
MNIAQKKSALLPFASYLVEKELISIEQAESVQSVSKKESIPFSEALEAAGVVADHIILEARSQEFGLAAIDLNAVEISKELVGLLEGKFVRKHQVLPLYKRGSKLFVAIGDLEAITACNELRFSTGFSFVPILASKGLLKKIISRMLSASSTDFEKLVEQSGATDDEDHIDENIVRFVDSIINDAMHRGASDIHIEPFEEQIRIRYRIDGVLEILSTPPLSIARRLTARIKILSGMDIAERRVPQDGRIHLDEDGRTIDIRVSSLPTIHGEKIVLRILDPISTSFGIDQLGFEPVQSKYFREALAKPDGMILVTGPTGSGKTVTLYTALGILNTPERNISTVEDPVEFNVDGINQVNINTKANLTFAKALKAFLRQDPDIIMLGEIRDLESADIAIKAAQTGHLVLSTLHTNDAPTTLTRLLNMGVPAFNISSAVNLIIAQRLARRLCDHCKEETSYPKEQLLSFGLNEDIIQSSKFYKPCGCNQCNRGFKGRTGIYEVMPLSEEIGRIIMDGGNAMDIAEQAQKEGIYNLRQAGILKVLEGITSLEEAERVTGI